MKIFYSLILIALISGCTMTGYQLKENPSGIYEYTITKEYKKVYRRIVQASKKCYESGERRIDANLFEDNGTAEVTLSIIYGGSINALYIIEIESISENLTKVKGYYSDSINDAWKIGVEDSKKWASGAIDLCRYKNL